MVRPNETDLVGAPLAKRKVILGERLETIAKSERPEETTNTT